MNEKYVKEFLNFQGIDNLRTENFIWIGLYSIFTILFIDINFLITLNTIKYCAIVLFANVIFNIMIILFFIINFQTRKMTIPKILLFHGKYYARKAWDTGIIKTFYYQKQYVFWGPVVAKSTAGQW